MRLTEIAHSYLRAQLREGDQAIDATAGNGHDTLLMASLVGTRGRVLAIDIQKEAIAATQQCLQTNGHIEQVRLLTGEHSEILASLYPTYSQSISAVTFNLGYLPGSDKRIRTMPGTTLKALDAARQLLQPEGLLLVTAYRGHEGGQTEADQVAEWMQGIQKNGWMVKNHEPAIKGDKIPPILWVAQQQ